MVAQLLEVALLVGARPLVAGDEVAEQMEGRVEALLDVVQELSAELQRLTSADPGQLLVDLIRLVERVGIARAGADRRDDAAAAAPADRAESGDRLAARDPERRVGVADPRPVERVRDDRDLVVADEDFVDD